jgi:hypothetical protein
VNVIEVSTQSELAGWKLGDWAEYYETRTQAMPALNVISLEFSQTPLRALVESPQVRHTWRVHWCMRAAVRMTKTCPPRV